MKCFYLPIVLIGLSLIVFVFSVPIDESKQLTATGKRVNQVYKQALNGNPGSGQPIGITSTSSDEDDDDDDDEDDDDDDDDGAGGLEEVLVDDDGDDDDDGSEENDDEDDDEDDEGDDEGGDGDYLERFFDDILGDDDDDDYDNDDSGAVPNVNTTSIVNTPPKPEILLAPAAPPQIEVVDVSSNLNPVNSEELAHEVVIVPEIQQDEESTAKPPVYELSISQDEESDEDDDFADGVIEARSISRGSKENKDGDSSLPSSILSNYNTVVDGVYNKLNRILKKMYDPINVQLTKQSKRSESKNFKKNKIRTEAPKLVKPKQTNVGAATKPIPKSKTRARGTMYGLSTLKRKGNIHVTSESNEDTIKSDFVLGPLVLKVSKSFSRGTKRELRSASAMTSKLRGRIILKVTDGTTVLHTIKIQQPKNIKIEVPGKKLNKNRELAWRKSLNIAHIVADQLSTVSRTMLKL